MDRKSFFVCKCGSVRGCISNGIQRWCETTKTGDAERNFSCDLQQYYTCTFMKDVLEDKNKGEKRIFIISGNTRCSHCPDESYIVPEEERGPIAVRST